MFIPFTSSANIVSLCGKFSDSPYHYTLAENVKVVRFEGISISSWIYNVPYPDEYSIHGDEPLTIYMSFVNPNSNDRLYFVPYNPSEQLPCSLDVVKRFISCSLFSFFCFPCTTAVTCSGAGNCSTMRI